LLNSELAIVNRDTEIDSVQQFWNVFEKVLVAVVCKLAPMAPFTNNTVSAFHISASIKKKKN
jgi:hypothetical protein